MNYLKRITFALILTLLIPVMPSTTRAAPGLVLTVGQGGSHSTIQAAVNTALGSLNSSPVEIRVATGTYYEHVIVPASMNQGVVTLSGGWSADFTSRHANPELTTIDADGQDRALTINPSGGELTVDGFTITGGQAILFGGGVAAELTGDATVTISNNRIPNNTVLSPAGSGAYGGGIYVALLDTARVFIDENVITGNLSDGGSDGPAVGAGLEATAFDDAMFFIRGNRIENNITRAPGNQCTGTGVYLYARAGSSGEFSDNYIRYNTAATESVVGAAGAMWMSSDATGRITARRNAWVDNVGNTVAEDVSLIPAHTGTVLFTDSVIAGARAVGVTVDARNSSSAFLTNLTIADNQHKGVFYREGPGTKTLYNTVLYNNGVASTLEGVDASNNLIDVDPRFANSAGRDYRLLPTSPGIDAGMNEPPGGRGPMDMERHERISGDRIDIGAYEMGESDFSLGVEPQTVTAERRTKIPVRIDITRFGEFTGNVTVTPPDLSSIGVKWKPKRPITTAGAAVSFKLKVKAGATPGTYEVTFTGRDDSGREHTATLTLRIE